MQNLIILNVQVGIAIVGYYLAYRIYFRDWLNRQEFGPAVQPLLLIHLYRFLGLTLLVTGQADPNLPLGAMQTIAFGDFAASVAALFAAIAVYANSSSAPLFVAIFTLIGLGDIAIVGYTAITANVFQAYIGGMWFLSGILAPVLLLSHIYIAYRLLVQRGPLPASSSSVANR